METESCVQLWFSNFYQNQNPKGVLKHRLHAVSPPDSDLIGLERAREFASLTRSQVMLLPRPCFENHCSRKIHWKKQGEGSGKGSQAALKDSLWKRKEANFPFSTQYNLRADVSRTKMIISACLPEHITHHTPKPSCSLQDYNSNLICWSVKKKKKRFWERNSCLTHPSDLHQEVNPYFRRKLFR